MAIPNNITLKQSVTMLARQAFNGGEPLPGFEERYRYEIRHLGINTLLVVAEDKEGLGETRSFTITVAERKKP